MMDDLISRQAALDEIDKNRQALLFLGMDGAEHILLHYGRRVIEELPTIDAVPVVRCKDCCYFHKTPWLIYEERNDGICEWIGETHVDEDHYCSWGVERSEDGET